MKKANVEKITIMMQDYLQYRYKLYFGMGKRNEDWLYYQGACGLIESIGGTWRRNYHGGESEEDKNNFSNYSHSVWLPSDEQCARLNEDAWKDG